MASNDLYRQFLDSLRGPATQRLSQISPYHQSVGSDNLPGEFASPDTSIIFSGPPSALMASKNQDWLWPIGTIQSANLGQNRPITKADEIGSMRPHLLAGKWDHQIALQKIITRSSNLLYDLYAWMDRMGLPDLPLSLPPGNDIPGLAKEEGINRYGRQWTIYGSDITKIPLGLMIVTVTADLEVLSSEYWERCMISGVNRQLVAGQPMISESSSIACAFTVPFDLAITIHQKIVGAISRAGAVGDTLNQLLNGGGSGPNANVDGTFA